MTSIKGYKLTDEIGSGAFGTVYKGIPKNGTANVAIKVSGVNDSIKNEGEILKFLSE